MGSCIDGSGDSVIQCVSVDDVLNSYEPNLIKLDVEGAEVEAIKGLNKTIKNYKPNLAVSVYHKPSHIYEIALLINSWNIGYQFYLRVHEHNTYGVVLYCLQSRLGYASNCIGWLKFQPFGQAGKQFEYAKPDARD